MSSGELGVDGGMRKLGVYGNVLHFYCGHDYTSIHLIEYHIKILPQ